MKPSKVRVLHVVGNMNKGGVQSFLMEVLRTSAAERYTHFFLCYEEESSDYEQEIVALGGKILRTPALKKVGPYKYVQNTRRIIRDHDIKIVHTHTYLSSAFPLLAAALEKTPVRAMHSHSSRDEADASFQRKAYVFLAKRAIGAFSTLRLACGESAGRALFNGREFLVIKNGIDTSSFEFNQIHRSKKRAELGVTEKDPVLLHIGRFVAVKNHKFLIKVFAEYLSISPNAILVLIGDGPMQNAIRNQVSDLDIQESVRFMGLRDDTADFYSAADLFLLPSISEGLPLTLLESQANGVPALVSRGVPLEAKIVRDLVFFKELQDSTVEWVKLINKITSQRNPQGVRVLQEAGYDSRESTKFLSQIYEKALLHTQ